ncbi:MAG: Gfo/Idh/MocA family protein [Pirellulales bacterium]
MSRLKLAVIGAGHLGRIHARLASGIAGIELVGIADPVAASRRQLAEEHHVAAFAHHRDLIGQVDAAVVAAPTRLHHEIGVDLARHGIHLLVEKPLAASLDEADALVAAAARSGIVLQVGHVERFNPAFKSVLPHLDEPKYIEAVRASGYTFRSTDIGVVLDLMIHDLDLVLALARSPVRQVEALGLSVLGKHEDIANARLVFENGCVATLSASRVSFQAARRMQIFSRQAFAAIDFATRNATLVRPSQRLASRQIDVDLLTSDEKTRLKDHLFEDLLPLERVQAEPCDAITAELNDFAESIRTGRAPEVTGVQARDAVAVAEAILAKIETHSWDGKTDGLSGPFGAPSPQILRGPHWRAKTAAAAERKEAG